MSWSQNSKCFTCVKSQDGCVDHTIIAHAVDIIHYLGTDNGHLGAGNIEMECQNYLEREECLTGPAGPAGPKVVHIT